MKTNQIMIRDNKSFVQRTKDGFFNANALLEDWNSKTKNKPLQLGNYKKNQSTKDFIQQLKAEGIDKPIISGRGKNGGTWMHPKLFIDFAMWVSVEFKSIVIDYVLDGLIKTRHEAGDYYNEMCAKILDAYVEYYDRKPPAYIFINEANLIREMVTSKKDRNEMTEQELRQITYLQKFNAALIDEKIGKEARIKRLHQANKVKI